MKNINFKKKYNYEEYFINDTYMKKLYNMYINKSFVDKIIDMLILFSLLLILMSLILKYLIHIDTKILLLIEKFSIFILIIFTIELYRDYLKSKNINDFFKNYWIDFLLIIFLNFYFLFISVLGFMKLFRFDFLKIIFSRLKHIRILYKHFKNKLNNFIKK